MDNWRVSYARNPFVDIDGFIPVFFCVQNHEKFENPNISHSLYPSDGIRMRFIYFLGKVFCRFHCRVWKSVTTSTSSCWISDTHRMHIFMLAVTAWNYSSKLSRERQERRKVYRIPMVKVYGKGLYAKKRRKGQWTHTKSSKKCIPVFKDFEVSNTLCRVVCCLTIPINICFKRLGQSSESTKLARINLFSDMRLTRWLRNIVSYINSVQKIACLTVNVKYYNIPISARTHHSLVVHP